MDNETCDTNSSQNITLTGHWWTMCLAMFGLWVTLYIILAGSKLLTVQDSGIFLLSANFACVVTVLATRWVYGINQNRNNDD